MVREEFEYEKVSGYLHENIDLLIAGNAKKDERSTFFINEWERYKKPYLLIDFNEEDSFASYTLIKVDGTVCSADGDITISLMRVLHYISMQDKNILVDITSLHHIVIMYLTKILIKQERPKSLFAVYIRPQKYNGQNEEFKDTLTKKILGVRSVPGFAKREREKQKLYSFIGFEGIRLTSIIENLNDIEKVVPIVAFPTGNPHWFNITMWNSRDILDNNEIDFTIQKCFSESVFEAVQLLRDIVPVSEHVVLAPLGTRPHSMAAAIFASQNNDVRIVHDYAIEAEERTTGISDIIVYHLSPFIEI